MDYKKVLEKAKEINKNLLATDKRFNQTTELIMEDDSIFLIQNSFYQKIDDYIVLFSEHYPVQVHHKDDVYCFYGYKKHI